MWHRGVVKRSTSGLLVNQLKQNHQGPEAEDVAQQQKAVQTKCTVQFSLT